MALLVVLLANSLEATTSRLFGSQKSAHFMCIHPRACQRARKQPGRHDRQEMLRVRTYFYHYPYRLSVSFSDTLHLLKVATQEVQLKGLESEVETRIKMERVAKREHFAAEAKKAWFMNEMKVSCDRETYHKPGFGGQVRGK